MSDRGRWRGGKSIDHRVRVQINWFCACVRWWIEDEEDESKMKNTEVVEKRSKQKEGNDEQHKDKCLISSMFWTMTLLHIYIQMKNKKERTRTYLDNWL